MMTRIINTFVVVLSTALSLTTPGEVSAQAAQDITFQQFLEFRINGSVKLEQLNTMAGDWTALKAAMGDPEEEVCEDVFVGEDCTFTWPGVTVWLTNVPTSEWEVSDVLQAASGGARSRSSLRSARRKSRRSGSSRRSWT